MLSGLCEERRHLAATDEIVHFFHARRRSAAVRRVQDLREEIDVARRVEEKTRACEHEPHREIDVALVGERLVPRRRARGTLARPRPQRDRLDRLDRDATFLAERDERLGVARVFLAGELRGVVREQHAVEGKALEALAVPPRALESVAGDADEAREAGVPRLDGGAERAVLPHRDVPLLLVDEVVQLQEVDVVDAKTPKRVADLVARLGVGALTGLCREEETVAAFTLEPRRDVQLRIAVAGGRVEVVQVVAEHELEGSVGLSLGDLAERGGAEDGSPALVTGAAEWCARDHGQTIVRRAPSSLESRGAKARGGTPWRFRRRSRRRDSPTARSPCRTACARSPAKSAPSRRSSSATGSSRSARSMSRAIGSRRRSRAGASGPATGSRSSCRIPSSSSSPSTQRSKPAGS